MTFQVFLNVHMALIYVVTWCNKEWLTKKSQTFRLLVIIYIYIYIQMGIRID